MTTRLTALLLLFSTILPTAFGQKITIQFAATPTATPSVSKAILKFNKDFAYSFTFDDATIDAFTLGMPVLNGGFVSQIGVTYPPLFTTDGCGNDVPFGAGIAWNSANLFNVDVHEVLKQGPEVEIESSIPWNVNQKVPCILSMAAIQQKPLKLLLAIKLTGDITPA